MWYFYSIIGNILITLLLLPVVVKQCDRNKVGIGLYLLFCLGMGFPGGILMYKIIGG